MTVYFARNCGWAGEISVEVLAAMNPLTFDAGIATMDDVKMGIQVLDESFRFFVILGGVFVGFLAVLVFSLYIALLVTELRKARR